MVGAGYLGRTLGAADLPRLRETLRDALGARIAGRSRAARPGRRRGEVPGLGPSLGDTRLAPVRVARDVVPAVYRVDPRTMPLGDMVRAATELGREVRALDPRLTYSHLGTLTEPRASSSLLRGRPDRSDLRAHPGHGLRGRDHGRVEPGALRRRRPPARLGDPDRRRPRAAHGTARLPDVRPRPRARGGRPRHRAPQPSTDRDVVVVTDPHYNALVAHEIVGHPVRARPRLKMEMAYAGRSWLSEAWTTPRSAGPSPRRSSPRTRTPRCPATATTRTTTTARPAAASFTSTGASSAAS